MRWPSSLFSADGYALTLLTLGRALVQKCIEGLLRLNQHGLLFEEHPLQAVSSGTALLC